MKRNYMIYLLAAFLLIAGCSNQKGDEKESSGESSAKPETSVLVDDLGNEVEMPASPERVIAPYLEDDLLTIDVMPAAQWSLNDGGSIQEYLQGQLKDVPTIPYDLPFEAVMEHDPDLIILNSAALAEGDKYNSYSKIAPTFVIESEKHTDWKQRLQRVAEIFGKEQGAEEKLAAYNKYADEKKEQIKEAVGDESAIALWWFQDSFFVVNENKSSGEVLYKDLGLAVPDLVHEIGKDAEDNWLPVSLERLAELDADHIFLITSQIGDSKEALKDNVFQHIPAVEKGNVHEFTMENSWLYSGYIANTQIIDDVADSLAGQK